MSLRGLLRGFGLKVGATTPSRFAGRIRDLVEGNATLEVIAAALLVVHETLRRELAGFEKRVRSIAGSDGRVRLLMSTPGVGAIVALTYVAAIDDPARFKSSKGVGAHFGLTPRSISLDLPRFRGRVRSWVHSMGSGAGARAKGFGTISTNYRHSMSVVPFGRGTACVLFPLKLRHNRLLWTQATQSRLRYFLHSLIARQKRISWRSASPRQAATLSTSRHVFRLCSGSEAAATRRGRSSRTSRFRTAVAQPRL